MPRVQLEHIRVSYRDVDVVRDVSFEVDDGEFAVLVGPSGSGKTTLLRTITGYAPISGGRVLIDGQDVTYRAPRDRDIAMVFQNLALYPHLTVRENWEFPLRAAKLSRAEREAQVQRVAGMLQMKPLLHRYPHQLSGGQKQRVAMGRALVRQPQLFLLDEPLGALDAKLRVEARSAFKALQRDLGITTIYVTHDQIEAQALGTKIVVLNDGVVQQVGSPEEIYDWPANRFVAGLFGSPPMNFLDVAVACENGALRLRRNELSIALSDAYAAAVADSGSGSEAILGVRPEAIELHREPELGSVAGSVYVLEPAGHHLILEVRLDGQLIRVRADRGQEWIEDLVSDAPVHLGINPARIHLFEGSTGRRMI